MKEPHPWKMIGRYEDGEEVIVGGSDAEDCTRKLLALEQLHGGNVSICGVSDDCYEHGRYIGKEAREQLQAIRKLLDEYGFLVSLKKSMETEIFSAVRAFAGMMTRRRWSW